LTRNGYDWSERYPSIVRAAVGLRCQSAIIDGEAIVQDGNGISDFGALQSAMRWHPKSIIPYAFDLMHLDEKDLRQQSLSVRRSMLKALIGSDEESAIQFSDEFDGDGDVLFKACVEHGLEGIMSKLALAPYRSGRTRTWLKTKCFTESTLWWSGPTATARPERLGLCSHILIARACAMPVQHSSPLMTRRGLSFLLRWSA
jgi:bifunctional non-homologous end joining protein LigD